MRNERVNVVAELVADGAWTPAEAQRLAAEWGESEGGMSEVVRRARRKVEADLLERSAVGSVVALALHKSLAGALEERDWRAAAVIAKTLASVGGMEKEQPMTDAEADRLLDEVLEMRGCTCGARRP